MKRFDRNELVSCYRQLLNTVPSCDHGGSTVIAVVDVRVGSCHDSCVHPLTHARCVGNTWRFVWNSVRDFDRFPALFGEDLGELVDVAEGVGSSPQGEATGGSLVVVLSVISLDVQLAQVLVVSKALIDCQPGVINSEMES